MHFRALSLFLILFILFSLSLSLSFHFHFTLSCVFRRTLIYSYLSLSLFLPVFKKTLHIILRSLLTILQWIVIPPRSIPKFRQVVFVYDCISAFRRACIGSHLVAEDKFERMQLLVVILGQGYRILDCNHLTSC